jgi:hypothetical protein
LSACWISRIRSGSGVCCLRTWLFRLLALRVLEERLEGADFFPEDLPFAEDELLPEDLLCAFGADFF